MKKPLFEEVTLKQSKMGDWDVYYLKWDTKEEGEAIWKQYDTLKNKYNVKYNKASKILFWFVDKENPQKTLDRIKSALDFLNHTTSQTGGESQEAGKLIKDIDKVIAAIDAEDPAKREEFNMSQQDEEDIKNKLQSFKQMLVNIENDEQFKETMKQIIDFKSAQGYEFSLLNALLIFLQNRKATIVNSKSNWESAYNRTVNPNAKALVIWAPQGQKFRQSKDKVAALKADFYKSIGKKEGDPLTPNEKIKLTYINKGQSNAVGFKLVPVYDVADTKQKEGTEDFIKKAQEAKKDIKWFEENMISDEVRPIYQGLIDFTKENEIKLDFIDDLGGARGSSASGAIKLLKNEGNDVGLTKTLAHEITHELLHQRYLSQKGKETGKYYIGQPSRETVEQQAELSAWMFMYAFGFDLKTTSLNYTIMWGGNKENMIKVFDTVSKVVNLLIDFVNRKIKQPVDEEQGSFQHGKHISPHDIAKLLGVEKTFDKLTQGELHERLLKRFNLK